MKKFSTVFYIVSSLLILSKTVCYSQSVASADVGVVISSPITISQTDNMVFGNVTIPGSGSVTTPVAGVITQTAGGTITQNTSTASATFNVSGQASTAYNVTVPSTSVTLSNGSDTMTATTFTSTASASGTESLTSTLSEKGSDTVKVGASLNANNRLSGGLYTAATPFTITVNYN